MRWPMNHACPGFRATAAAAGGLAVSNSEASSVVKAAPGTVPAQFGGHFLTQGGAGTRQALAHRRIAQTEQPGHLPAGLALPVKQSQHLAAVVR